MNPNDKLCLLAVGDIIPDRPNPEKLFDLVMPALSKADILFGQLEAPLSEKGEPQLQLYPVRKIPSDRVSALVAAGFDVLSFASNHTLDRGEEALFETMDVIKKNQIGLIGVGRNIEEARKPLIVERKGARVGFLAYCSVLPKGYDARADKSGAAPMRASTYYEQVDWQAGTPPRIVTFADKNDLAAMVTDIKKLRPLVDVLVLSIHWGIHFVPSMLAMYQKEVGYAAIDAGVDLILGHHAHILKGIEVYKGKVIFYSMCNLVMPSGKGRKPLAAEVYGMKDALEWPDYAFPVDSRKSMIVKATISGKRIDKVSFLPVMINRQAQPEVLPRSDSRSSEVVAYLEWCCRDQGLNAQFAWDGNEVVISRSS